MIMEEYVKEKQFAEACNMQVCAERMEEAGLGPLLQSGKTPRQRCQAFAAASEGCGELADEQTQRIPAMSTFSSCRTTGLMVDLRFGVAFKIVRCTGGELVVGALVLDLQAPSAHKRAPRAAELMLRL